MGSLGKKQKKGERKKALPDLFPGEGPAGLADAYGDLSRSAYAVWIRLAVASKEDLAGGRGRIAALLGYSERRSNEVLLELERKGYISFIASGPWQPTKVILERKPMIERGKNQFVRLRSMLLENSDRQKTSFDVGSGVVFAAVSIGPNPQTFLNPSFSYPNRARTYPMSATQLPGSVAQLPGSVTQFPVEISESKDLCTSSVEATADPVLHHSASRKKVFRQKFVCEEGYVDPKQAILEEHRKKIVKAKEDEKTRRKDLRSRSSKRREVSNARNRAKGITVIDWEVLEEITFDPRSKKHGLYVEVLKRDPRNKQRKKLMERLETEFCRLYSRYRRAAERARGTVTVNYEVHPKERKFAALAGELCITRNVTPRQVLEYWHAHIKNFTKASTMTIPSLRFLASAANIDTVACSIVPDKTASGGGRVKAPEPLTKPKAGNSFSDTSGLDVRLRSGLEGAGFETQDFNDRYLLTIQKTAIAMAMGRDIFVGKGRIREMAEWAATNLYSE